MGTTHVADFEGEGCLLADEGVNHAQIVVAEADLSWQHQETPDPKVHAQTVGAELEATSDGPDAIEEVGRRGTRRTPGRNASGSMKVGHP